MPSKFWIMIKKFRKEISKILFVPCIVRYQQSRITRIRNKFLEKFIYCLIKKINSCIFLQPHILRKSLCKSCQQPFHYSKAIF